MKAVVSATASSLAAMTATTVLPFDAHNHVHMGPTHPVQALLPEGTVAAIDDNNNDNSKSPSLMIHMIASLSGMALMSTHPRDFGPVERLAQQLPTHFTTNPPRLVPCFGIHPWWLHELTDDDWHCCCHNCNDDDDETTTTNNNNNINKEPRWLQQMQDYLLRNPKSIVGEVGLDGFHFCQDEQGNQRLSSTMERQVQALKLQLQLAVRLNRPVSLHAVQCWGPLQECLSGFQTLPPKIYFHAFGGKEGTVNQLTVLCRKRQSHAYFGFAPVINFRSGKTAAVARKAGLERILLETDHEDAKFVPESVQQGIQFLAECFRVNEDIVVKQTTQNAWKFYGIVDDDSN